MFKWPEKVLLEPEVGELALLNKLCSQLPQRIHGEERDILPRTTSYPVEMVAKYLPDPGPLQSNTTHIIIRDFDNFCEREHAWLCRVRQLLERDL